MRFAYLKILQCAILVCSFLACKTIQADDVWEAFETRTQASLRGLVAVSKEVVWACGSQGTNRPRGFRSSVVAIASRDSDVPKTTWLTCGPSGCDWSSNGEDWSALSDIGFHAMGVSPDHTVWAAGSVGRIAVLNKRFLR